MNIRSKLLTVGLGALIAGVGSSALAVTEFNASVWFPDGQPLTKYGYLEWAKKLSETSGGSLKAKVFTGTVLLSPNAHMSGVRDGIAQIGYHAGTYTPSELHEDNVLAHLALNYSDLLIATFAVTEMNMTDPELLAQWKRNKIVFGGGYASVPYRLICTSKVQTLADMKGKKVRMPGAVHSDWAKSVGAVAVAVPSSEMYSGLEKGQIDCASNGANEMKSRSLWDVAKHTNMVNLGVYWAGYLYGMNADFWRKLTPKDRRTMFNSFAESMVETELAYVTESDEAVAEAPKHNVTIYQPSADLKRSVDDFQAAARLGAIEMGKEKFKMKDPEALIKRFETMAAKWEKLLANVDRKDKAKLTALVKTEIYDKIDVNTYGVK